MTNNDTEKKGLEITIRVADLRTILREELRAALATWDLDAIRADAAAHPTDAPEVA